MKPVTAGEKLYLLIRDEMLSLIGDGPVRWKNVHRLLDEVTADTAFAEYLQGAVAIHVTRRLLRYWEDERPLLAEESQHGRHVMVFVRRSMFPSIGEEAAWKIARAVIAAERASHRPITGGTRKLVLLEYKRLSCFLCGGDLDSAAPEGAAEFLTLEHLWPTSMGGDSVPENLLPACRDCQKTTKDTLSWEWPNIHNLVLPANPSPTALARGVNRRLTYAKHYFDAVQRGKHRKQTLKEAFLELGPVSEPISHAPTGLPITFFDLRTAPV